MSHGDSYCHTTGYSTRTSQPWSPHHVPAALSHVGTIDPCAASHAAFRSSSSTPRSDSPRVSPSGDSASIAVWSDSVSSAPAELAASASNSAPLRCTDSTTPNCAAQSDWLAWSIASTSSLSTAASSRKCSAAARSSSLPEGTASVSLADDAEPSRDGSSATTTPASASTVSPADAASADCAACSCSNTVSSLTRSAGSELITA